MTILVIAGLLFAALTAIARFVTIWIVERTPIDPIDPITTVSTVIEPSDKTDMIQQQLDSKVLWDTPDYEILEWLELKHTITDTRAAEMLQLAKVAKMRSIREKALYGAIVSGGGALITGGLVAVQLYGGAVLVIRSLLLTGAFGFCLFWFVRYLRRLVTGRTDSPAGL